MPARPFEIVCEIEPPTRADLRRARHQIAMMAPVADRFLIPDNHIGRATVSSVAVAHEVATMGARSIACLNARDRNLLGLRRDLLTAAAYGVSEFLFVYGDKPADGSRTSELTVRSMMAEARAVGLDPDLGCPTPFRVGVAAGLRPLPAWKREADFVFAQICFSVDALLRWRDSVDVDVPVYAGVLVVPSRRMAERVAASIPDIEIPPALLAALDRDPDAGVTAACDQVLALAESGAFDGVHLIPVTRYPQVAARLAAAGVRAG
jgi:methylenetetrahydrofolate reductase (NADPH)